MSVLHVRDLENTRLHAETVQHQCSGFPVDAKLTWPHPLRGGTCVYAQVRDITNPDTLHWNPGTVNACVKKEDGYRYHILFDNEEEGHDLQEKSVLHRLDYDKIFKHK